MLITNQRCGHASRTHILGIELHFMNLQEPIVDPINLVGYLLAEFDGSERMAVEVRRAMLRAACHLPFDHPVRETIDTIARDLTVAVIAMGGGSDGNVFRSHLVERWHGVAREIKKASLH